MENRNDILNELKELGPTIAAIEKVNVFTVPGGYFDHLATDILMGIREEIGSNKNNFSVAAVPNGYFDSLADSILSKIKAQETADEVTEIKTLSPQLFSIKNKNVFEVPEGYFENVIDEVLNKVIPKAKVIAMESRRRIFLKYAVAAAFTGLMALGVFKFTGSKSSDTVLPVYVKAGLEVQNVDQELANISDADIAKYLESTGTDVKAAIVANSIDKNELPTQEDYLLDEQALDKYLNSINVEELKN